MQVLQKADIGCRAFALPPAPGAEVELDAGLRRQLGMQTSVFAGCRPFFSHMKEGTVYHVADRFYLHYLFLVLPGGGQCLAIGPYLSLRPSERQVVETAGQWSLAPARARLLAEFYTTLPLIVDSSPFYSLVYCLCEAMHGGQAKVRQLSLEEEMAPADLAAHTPGTDLKTLMQRLENRYRQEEMLIRAVTAGDRVRLRQLMSNVDLSSTVEPRLADPVRNLKNYCIIMNTILRKAAQTGGVHPIHVDDMSRTFAARIEQLTSTTAANRLVEEMADAYCLLVQQQSLADLPEAVRFGVLYVRRHLADPLNLHTVAAAAGANPSYYSALFKKETGRTLTEFILQERMRLAMHLLLDTRLQVQTVAQYCGFLDVNYFCRLFRQVNGTTPTQFRRRGKSLQA